MATFPSVDLTDCDPASTVRAVRSAGDSITDAATTVAKDATYTAIGLAVLSYQRLQVRRREFERLLQR